MLGVKLQCNLNLHTRKLSIPTLLVSSVAQSCLTLCNPMNHSTPGLPIHHQLLEFTQAHIHQVGDAIQPSHPLSSPSLLPPIPPSIRVFPNESTLRMRWPKYWSFSFSISPSNEHPGLISLDLLNCLFPRIFFFFFSFALLVLIKMDSNIKVLYLDSNCHCKCDFMQVKVTAPQFPHITRR